MFVFAKLNGANNVSSTSCAGAATICPTPVTLTFDLLTLKVVSESCVTWATSVPTLVFLGGISHLDLGPMYATDVRQTDRHTSDVRQHHCLMMYAMYATDVRQTDRQTSDGRQHHCLIPRLGAGA